MDDGLAAIVERFLVEHVLVGLGNVRARIDLLEGDRVAANEPASLDLRAIAGHIDRLESHARALQFLLRDRPRPPAAETGPAACAVVTGPAAPVRTAHPDGGLAVGPRPAPPTVPDPAEPPGSVAILERVIRETSSGTPDPDQSGVRTPSGPRPVVAPDDRAAASAPAAPITLAAEPQAPQVLPDYSAEGMRGDPLLTAIAAELSRMDMSVPPPASQGSAAGSGPADSSAPTSTEPQTQAAPAPEPAEAGRQSPLLLTDPAVPPVRIAASTPVFTSRRQRAPG